MSDQVAGADPAGGEGVGDLPERTSGAQRWPLVLVTVAIVLVLDQLTKRWALEALVEGPQAVLGPLQWRLAFNTGAAFSLGAGTGIAPWLALGAIVMVGVLAWTARSATTRLGAVALGLVVGGALGNLMDRGLRGTDGIFTGAVVDFIDVGFWPVFNVADMGVVVGGLLLVVAALRMPEEA